MVKGSHRDKRLLERINIDITKKGTKQFLPLNSSHLKDWKLREGRKATCIPIRTSEPRDSPPFGFCLVTLTTKSLNLL